MVWDRVGKRGWECPTKDRNSKPKGEGGGKKLGLRAERRPGREKVGRDGGNIHGSPVTTPKYPRASSFVSRRGSGVL